MKSKLKRGVYSLVAAIVLSALQLWVSAKTSLKVMWQVSLMVPDKGPVMGYDTSGNPLYEGTPVHLVMAYTGLGLGVVVYAVVVYLLIWKLKPTM